MLPTWPSRCDQCVVLAWVSARPSSTQSSEDGPMPHARSRRLVTSAAGMGKRPGCQSQDGGPEVVAPDRDIVVKVLNKGQDPVGPKP